MGRKSKEVMEAEKAEADARFNEAVSAKVAEMLPGLVGQIMAQVGSARADAAPLVAPDPAVADFTQPATAGGDKAFASSLALAIANLSAQGTGKQDYVPPETLERWALARKRMTDLIIAARTAGGDETPTYKLKKMVFFNEMRVQPQYFDAPTKAMKETIIYWDEVPNEEMVPVNASAQAIHAEFLNSIGATIDKNMQPDRPWIRSEKRLFRGMSNDQRQAVYGTPMGDPRVEGHGAPTTGHRVAMLGSVAAPAIVR
jgi:hypothetical protein